MVRAYSVGSLLHLRYKVFLRPPLEEVASSATLLLCDMLFGCWGAEKLTSRQGETNGGGRMKKFSLVLMTLLTMLWVSTCFAQSADDEPRDPNAPENTIKIPGRDIYVNGMDEPKRMSWDAANSVCNCKGKGWRLPTIGESQTIYQYQDMLATLAVSSIGRRN